MSNINCLIYRAANQTTNVSLDYTPWGKWVSLKVLDIGSGGVKKQPVAIAGFHPQSSQINRSSEGNCMANSILKCFSSPLLFILQPDCIIQASFLNRNFRTVCCFGEGNSGRVGEEGQKTEREGWGEIVNVFDLLVPGIMHKCLISFNPTNILKAKCIIMLLSAENIAKVKRLPRVISEKQSQILRNC